jgi:hypothetical protein
VLEELRKRGFAIRFVGKTLQFKSAPGMISPLDPHFEIRAPGSIAPTFKLYTDIEVGTLGSEPKGAVDNSCYHEIDIVVVDATATGRPSHKEVALGVECKSTANFDKSIVREALGLRRQLSYVRPMLSSRLSISPNIKSVAVPAEPASEYWLAFIDVNGLSYSASPATFGIEFQHWEP